MSKVLKVLVGSALFSAAVVGIVAGVKVLCDRKKEKYVSPNNIEDFVVYVTTPEESPGDS